MLLNFSVSNFCSFGETAHFTMEAGRTRNFAERTARTPNAKILKFKAVYGANASGKSNLVKAILFLRVMNQNKESLYGENSPIKIYRTLYYWFRHRLSVNYPDEPITQYNYFFDSQRQLIHHFKRTVLANKPAYLSNCVKYAGLLFY